MNRVVVIMLLVLAVVAGVFYVTTSKKTAPEPELPKAEEPPRTDAAQPAPGGQARQLTPEEAGRPAGLYMIFETSMGDITCKLYEAEAPVTVRKIVGLALGRITWIDPRTNKPVVGKPFYDGLTFHRVIPNFMIQGGDPLGTGTGGPGGPDFPFEDEFHPRLKFDQPGRLAMANSGPNTNGSQFFITEVPTPHLNNRHTIFGDCTNVSVVRQIARVRTDPRNNRPLQPVTINRVIVERVGPRPANAPEG